MKVKYLLVLAGLLITGCGGPEQMKKSYEEGLKGLDPAKGNVYVQEHNTPSGMVCVIATKANNSAALAMQCFLPHELDN